MTWKATITSVTTSVDPRAGLGVGVAYTDLTSSFSVNYSVDPGQDPVSFISAQLRSELDALTAAAANPTSYSSFVGNAYTVNVSGNLQPSSF